jgi:anaerobic ribonucleoside-triphosphate reductase
MAGASYLGTCPKCGKELINACPICGAEAELYSRIVGYLRSVKLWNDGKIAEFGDRATYSVNPEKEDKHQKGE